MGLKLQDPIATARGILNDTSATPRYSDIDLLQYANDALDVLVTLAPTFFESVGTHVCQAGATQLCSLSDALAIVDVRRVVNGPAVHPTTKEALDSFDPSWTSATPGEAVNWAPAASDPLRFYTYPPAPVNQGLEVIYTRIPSEYASTADTGLPTVYGDAIADYIIHRAESRDDEYVNNNRAAQFLASFSAKVKGS